MEDSIRVMLSGTGNINEIRPTNFNWLLYLIAFTGMILTSLKVFYLSAKETSDTQ
jgi:hypothetical protein